MRFEIEIPDLLESLSGIYKIENDINDMVYIGRAKNLRKRAEGHRMRYKNKDCNSKVNKFLEEHPEANFKFTVVEFTNSIKDEEERYIAEYGAVERGFNILHNDEEFLEKKWVHGKKKRKKRHKEEPEYKPYIETNKELLKRGYFRIDNKLKYNPQKAKIVLVRVIEEEKKEEECIPKEIQEEVMKTIKKYTYRRDKDWKPADLSFLFRKNRK